MNIDLSAEELAFREQVRYFLADDYPETVREKRRLGVRLSKQDQVDWQHALYQRGWAGINWPVEYGGTGWTPTQKYIFYHELAAANAPGLVPFGLNMAGPIIYTFGNAA